MRIGRSGVILTSARPTFHSGSAARARESAPKSARLAIESAIALDRPNLIIVLADDLGINDLGCYGRKDHHTPHLDKLATHGMRFTSFYCAQPICSPSRAALLTGKTPAR